MKHVLSILLLLTALPAFAQKATVERVVSDPLNIAASKYPMTDLNGHTAPLVIVEVLTDNVEFKGNVLDGGVVRRTGEYWVYMGVGTKILRIQSDKFLPVDIRFPDCGIPRLEPASTYVVTLALPPVPFIQTSVPDSSQIVAALSTTPVHLALCATDPKHRTVYITADQWRTIPATAQSSFILRGVCLADTDNPFIVELHDKENGNLMDWNSAMKCNLPTEKQAEVLVNNWTALNEALQAFEGTLMHEWSGYWTKTTFFSDEAYIIAFNHNSRHISYCPKSSTQRVRAVVSLPGIASSSNFSTAPLHLALCATGPDGRTVYISADQWQALPAPVCSYYKPLGVCLADGDVPFLINLHDRKDGRRETWKSASKHHLPTKDQAEIIVWNIEGLNKALQAFGGTAMNTRYWTDTELKKGSSYAWSVLPLSGIVDTTLKSATSGVRSVAACPTK